MGGKPIPRKKRSQRAVELTLPAPAHTALLRFASSSKVSRSAYIARLMEAPALLSARGHLLAWSGPLPAKPTLTLELCERRDCFWLVKSDGSVTSYTKAIGTLVLSARRSVLLKELSHRVHPLACEMLFGQGPWWQEEYWQQTL